MASGSMFPNMDSETQKRIKAHCFVLFRDFPWQKFLPEMKKNIEKKGSSAFASDGVDEVQSFLDSGLPDILEMLKKDKEVLSRFDELRIPDEEGLIEERYITAILSELSKAIAIAAAKSSAKGKMLFEKEKEWSTSRGKPYYLQENHLARVFIGEIDENVEMYARLCRLIKISKEDVAATGKELASVYPHKLGWLEKAEK